MLHVLTIVLPIFGLIAIGFAARLTGLVTDRTAEGLSEFVFAIAVPALIFHTLNGAAFPQTQPWGYWFAYFAGVAIVWTVTQTVARRFWKVEPIEGVVAGFASSQSNTVFVGVPLILEAYGPDGAVPLFLLIAIHMPILLIVGAVLSEGRSVRPARLVRQLATNPMLLAIVVSTVVRLSGVSLPGTVTTIIDMLGQAASPCALFAMGIALRRYGLAHKPSLAAFVTALKLVVHPALVFFFAFHVFSVPPVWAGVAVLFAAAPCGLNAYLFAERYRSGVAVTASAITLSTGLSVVTTTFWLAMLGVGR
jgi:malonate transporter